MGLGQLPIVGPVAQGARAVAHRAGDVLAAGAGPLDPALWRAELSIDHRVRARRFIAEHVPKHGRGVEIGVFTGLFSAMLLEVAQPREAWFVDVWWDEFGPIYPDWGAYTAWGTLSTRTAFNAARRRIARAGRDCVCHVVIDRSESFLAMFPPAMLDWAYLDSGHDLEGTRDELALLASRLRPGGVLIGDDWDENPASPHHGVYVAVQEAIAAGRFELIGSYGWKQFALRATGA